MKTALPTAPAAYGLSEPSATVTVDNATTAGRHLAQRKICPNKRVQFCFQRYCMAGQSSRSCKTELIFAFVPGVTDSHAEDGLLPTLLTAVTEQA
jgi:hypothetical protein